MEFPSRGPAGGSRFADDSPPHGDPMVVVRDALLSQLQQDRIRQEIVVAELAKIERAMALRVASPSPSPSPRRWRRWKDWSKIRLRKRAPYIQVQKPMPMPPSTWSCAVCQVRTTSERNLRDHYGGQKHQSKVAALESRTNAMAGQKAKTTTAKPSPVAGQKTYTAKWSCSLCQVNCNCEWNFDTHLKGKRHQAHTRALLEQSKKSSGNSVSHGTKLQPSNMNQNAGKKTATWICRVCEAHCTCELDLQNHLKGKRHQLNLQALNTSSDGSSRKSAAASEMMDKQTALYFCKVCSLKCTSERMLSDHLRGKRHSKQEGLLAFCEVCNLQCNSEKMLADHRYGKKHQANLNAKK